MSHILTLYLLQQHKTVKPAYAVTSIKQSYVLKCHLFVLIEPLLRGHLSYNATFFCTKGDLLIHVLLYLISIIIFKHISKAGPNVWSVVYIYILCFTFLFSLFVFVSAAGQYFSILTGPDQYNVFFRILSELVFYLRYTITKTCRLTDMHVLSII